MRRIIALMAAAALLPALAAAPASAAQNLTVTTTADGAGGICPALPVQPCSLRAAVTTDNRDGGGDTVILPAGRYEIGSQLAINRAITIRGTGTAADTIVDAAGHPGVFEISLGHQADTAATLQHLTVTGSAGDAGIVAFNVNPLSIDDVIVRANHHDTDFGGGLALAAGDTAIVTNSLFAFNSALGGGAIGVSLTNTRQSLEIDDSELRGNAAGSFGGGALLAGFSDVAIDRSRLDDNLADHGGAIASLTTGGLDPSLALRDSTLDGNRATPFDGGAIDLPTTHSGAMLAESDTFVDNSAPDGGDFSGSPSAVLLHNSILGPQAASACADGIVVASRGHNLAADDSCHLNASGDRQSVDPRLGTVSDNGGPTATALPQADSPALDAADPVGCQPADQRDVRRPQGAGCDIGAAERSVGGPHAVTGPPSGAAATGTADPGGQTTTVTVEFGPTPAYGSVVGAGTVSGWLPAAVRAALPAPAPGATLHYRVVAVNASGSAPGADATLSTPAGPDTPGRPGGQPAPGGSAGGGSAGKGPAGGGPAGRGSAAGAPPLSDRGALDVAYYGRAEAWLQRGTRSLEVAYRVRPGARARLLLAAAPAPSRAVAVDRRAHLALGLDARGRLTVVLEGARGLMWLHVDGAATLHRVAGTGGGDSFPSLFRGALADSRVLASGATTVRVGSLTSARSHVVWRGRSRGPAARDTALGTLGAVVFVVTSGRADGVMLARPHRAAVRLLSLRVAGPGRGGLAIDRVSPSGALVTVIRQAGASVRRVAFQLPSGRR